MKYQFDFLLPLKLQKISCNLSYDPKILLTNQFAGFFTFDFFDLSILIPGGHCYIVLVKLFSYCLYFGRYFPFFKTSIFHNEAYYILHQSIEISTNYVES